MQSAKTKNISVLLIKYSDCFSNLFNLITGSEYTHASIGIEEYNHRFFSFNTKGSFRVERPMKSKKPEKMCAPCILYRLEVTEEVYAKIKNRLQKFSDYVEKYKYNYLGLLFCVLGITYRSNHCYFCSQFVSELISSSGVAQLQKQPPLYLPKDFSREPSLKLCYQGSLIGLAECV